MITKHAIVLAIILATASGSLVTKTHEVNDLTYNQSGSESSSAQSKAPAVRVILAQGRCYNGRCY